jgi:hypothetical protein
MSEVIALPDLETTKTANYFKMKFNRRFAVRLFFGVFVADFVIGLLICLIFTESPVASVLFWILNFPALVTALIFVNMIMGGMGPGGDDPAWFAWAIPAIFSFITAFFWAAIGGRIRRKQEELSPAPDASEVKE